MKIVVFSALKPSAQLSDLFGWLRQQRSMREPKGSAALDHVGAARRSRRSRNLGIPIGSFLG
jgi:hypothetical protein